jgi:tripartite-type tricarboxylate transporter receptor subunit TctC
MPISRVLFVYACSVCSPAAVAAATSEPYPSKPIRLIVPLAQGGAPGLVSRRPVRGKGVEAGGFYPIALTTSQPYPSKPIRLIVPLAPAGGMDTIARGIALKLTDSLGQTVVVDNRGGGGGSIGAELVAHAAPDGYTLLMMSATGVIHTIMYKAQYDAVRDFAAVSQVTTQPYVIVVTLSIPPKSVTELVAYAKSNPGKLSYSSSGNGSLIHLTGELFKSVTGIDMVHIPYKGIAASYPDLIAGQIQLTFASIISALPMIRAQRLRALAVTSAQRAKALSELPTVAESGVPGFAVTQWYGVQAPAGTPRPIVERLNREIVRTLQLADVLSRLANDGAEAAGSTPQQFADHIKTEHAKWARIIKQAGIRGE